MTLRMRLVFLVALLGGSALWAQTPPEGAAPPAENGAATPAAGAEAEGPVPGGAPLIYMVPMRDGVRLSTAVQLPAGTGPWPALLVRTPYDKHDLAERSPAFLAAGIACCAQDMRGFFASEGRLLIPFMDDGWGPRRDGYDSVEWIAAQPWCDGRVVTVGASALGITQYLMGVTNPPGLVTQHIELAPISLYHGAAHPGGVAQQSLLEAWLPARGYSGFMRNLIIAWNRYDVIWRQFDATTREGEVNLPAMHWVGWFDQFRDSNIEGFRSRQHRGGAGARGRQHMVIGPWVHREPWARTQGEMTFPPNAAHHPWYDTTDDNVMRARYFQEFLNDPEALARRPAVTYYLMGAVGEPGAPGNEWRSASDWPLPDATTRTFYLHADGTLADQPAAARCWAELRHDPDDPVPSRGGANEHIPAGSFDQQPVEAHPDVLTFTTTPLDAPLVVAGGPVRLHVELHADAPDADLAVRLSDVYPDGRSMLITDGIQRASHRAGFERVDLLWPTRTVPLTVEVGHTAIAINRGHRLRISVSTTNAPRFLPHRVPNWLGGREVRVRLRMWGERGARLELPVLAR